VTQIQPDKSFEQLYVELSQKISLGETDSGSVRLVQAGTHAIGKKIVEEAAEVWMAAEYQGKEERCIRNIAVDLPHPAAYAHP